MTPRELLEPEDIELLQEIKRTLNTLTPVVDQLVQEGFPVREHLERLRERNEWFRKVETVFGTIS